MRKPKLLVFASGEKDPQSGGSGFKKLVEATREGILDAEIVGVVSNHWSGGVYTKAMELGVRFLHFKPARGREGWGYNTLKVATGADFVALSGWLKKVAGLDPSKTFNIHPGPLPEFGGNGMYGHHVHEAVMKAYHERGLQCSEVCMHFVTKEYDDGPVFFRLPVPIEPGDTAKTLQGRVNEAEHRYQAKITNMVVHGYIEWDGINKSSLIVPNEYDYHRRS